MSASPPARAEVWWCELPHLARRPVVVLTRDRLGRLADERMSEVCVALAVAVDCRGG